ncbi:hypothetical protein GGP51_002189 [Salinibacter ruber]|nr:hypothetical protein [Salinibacter ruber]
MKKKNMGVCPVPTASATLFIHAKPWGVKSEAKTPAGRPGELPRPG